MMKIIMNRLSGSNNSPSTRNELIYIILIIIVSICVIILKYPASTFGHVFNSILGKSMIVFLIILLTSYNTLIGLIATVMIIGVYSLVQKKTHEGFAAIPPFTPLTRPQQIPDGYGQEKNTINQYVPETKEMSVNDIKSANGTTSIEVVKDKDKENKEKKEKHVGDISSNTRRNTLVDKVTAEESIRAEPSNVLPTPHFKTKNEPVSNWPDKNAFSTLNSGV